MLVDLKLPPSVLEVPVPRFFIEDQQRALEEREKLLDVLMLQVTPPTGRQLGWKGWCDCTRLCVLRIV